MARFENDIIDLHPFANHSRQPVTTLQAPPLATNNETLIAIIAHEDIVNIERVIAVFSPTAAVIFFNK